MATRSVASEDAGFSGKAVVPETVDDVHARLRRASSQSREHAMVFAKAVFAKADTNRNGSLSKTEIRRYFKNSPHDKAHILGSDFSWKTFFAEMDLDNNGCFDMKEFVTAVTRIYHDDEFEGKNTGENTGESTGESTGDWDSPEVPQRKSVPEAPVETGDAEATGGCGVGAGMAATSLEAGFVNSAVQRFMDTVPVDPGEPGRTLRLQMFDDIDLNGNGYLSLAEVDKGIRDVLQCDELFNAKPAIMRAFQAAKGAAKTGSKLGADFVERAEFRLLLVYLKRYFELFLMFEVLDTGHDRRVGLEEFSKAVNQLERRWGMVIADSTTAFTEIDRDGGGQILFDEFCDWAIEQNIVHDIKWVSEANNVISQLSGHILSGQLGCFERFWRLPRVSLGGLQGLRGSLGGAWGPWEVPGGFLRGP